MSDGLNELGPAAAGDANGSEDPQPRTLPRAQP